MVDYLKRYFEFILVSLAWVVAGVYINDFLALGLACGSLVLYNYKARYSEMIMSLILVCALSDNRHYSMSWTLDTKNVMMVLMAVFYLLNRKLFTHPNKFFWAFIPMFMVALFLVYRSPDPFKSFQKTMSYALFFICIPPYFFKLFEEKGFQFLRDFIFFAIGLLCLGLVYAVVRPDLAYLIGRYNGILGNPNGIGIFCDVVFFAFFIVNDKYPDLFSKVERQFIYGVIIISLLLSGSRTGIMSIFILLLFARFHKLSPYYGFALLIFIGISYQMFTDNITVILRDLGLEKSFRSETVESGSGRFVAWQFAWLHIQENYLLGMGWDYDNYLFDKYREVLSKLGHNGGVHNIVLGFWLSLGAVGLVCFIFGFIRSYLLVFNKNRLALPFMYAVLFSTTFEAWLMGSLNPFTVFWIFTFAFFNYEYQFQPKARTVPVL
ncbi:MAG: O-antigen ligase family protein [Bacteroidetes bacterium]|nr:O-antigen ligase family protein [Bacteroidota bacterium]